MTAVPPRFSSTNVRQDVFPLDQWTITTRNGIIMQSQCTCKNAESLPSSSHPKQQPLQHLTKKLSDRESDKEPIELCDLCRYHRFLPHLHSMPDMLFNNNLFRLEHSSGVGIEFNPLDALRLVEETNDPLKVAVADGWQSARADCPFAKNVSKPFDWTFTTSYRGTLLSAITKSKRSTMTPDVRAHTNPLNIVSESRENNRRNTANEVEKSDTDVILNEHGQDTSVVLQNPDNIALPCNDAVQDRLSFLVEETDERIDVNKLKVKEEILFYDDITLYEDELADHGTAQYSVKVRVMPSCLFILARYYLRIDGVMARINDTRIYHELKQKYILREYTNREAKVGSLNLPNSTLVNANELMNHLPLIEKRYEKLILPTAEAR